MKSLRRNSSGKMKAVGPMVEDLFAEDQLAEDLLAEGRLTAAVPSLWARLVVVHWAWAVDTASRRMRVDSSDQNTGTTAPCTSTADR